MTRLLIALILLIASSANAAVTLTNGQWSSTFNCADWNQNTAGSPVAICDGMTNDNPQNTCEGQVSHVDSSANNPSGSGKGFKQFICAETPHNQSGSPRITLAAPVPEMWVRWYQQYRPGFAWTTYVGQYHKLAYEDNLRWVIDLTWNSEVALYDLLHGQWHLADHSTCTAGTNKTGMDLSIGSWHYVEVHMKVDTNGTNGVFEAWVDGTLQNTHNDVNYGGNNFQSWTMFVNQDVVATSAWADLDDIAVSTTGYIGALGAPSSTPGTCGTAAGQTFSSAPTTNLCATGTASAVTGAYTWTCTVDTATTCNASYQAEPTSIPTAKCSGRFTLR